MTLEELRAQFPQYSQVSDLDFLMGVHRKMYPDVHMKQFINAIGGADLVYATADKDSPSRQYYKDAISQPLPDETPEATAQRLGGTAQGPVGNAGGQFGTAVRSGLQGATFGFGDEIVAGAAAALDPNADYEQYVKAERDRLELGRQQFPKTAMASEIGGAVVAPGAAIGAMGAAKLPVRMAAGGMAGMGQAGLYGFGTGEGGVQERAQSAMDAAPWGAVAGAAMPVLGVMGQKAMDGMSKRAAINEMVRGAPTTEGLRNQASQIFSQADNVTDLPRSMLTQAAPQLDDAAKRLGMDPILTPQSARAAARIGEEAASPNPNIGFRDLDILRRQASVAAGNASVPTEASIGSSLVNGIDDVIDNIDPNLAEGVQDARKMWGQMRRTEMIDGALEKADNMASGAENGTRNKIRAILNSDKKMRGFSPDEAAAMKKVVKGTTVGNALNKVGRMGIGTDQQRNFLGMALSSGGGGAVGSMFGGPVGAAIGGVVAPAVGTMAQKGADAITKKNAEILRALVVSGGKLPDGSVITGETAKAIQQMLMRGANGINSTIPSPSMQAR